MITDNIAAVKNNGKDSVSPFSVTWIRSCSWCSVLTMNIVQFHFQVAPPIYGSWNNDGALIKTKFFVNRFGGNTPVFFNDAQKR